MFPPGWGACPGSILVRVAAAPMIAIGTRRMPRPVARMRAGSKRRRASEQGRPGDAVQRRLHAQHGPGMARSRAADRRHRRQSAAKISTACGRRRRPPAAGAGNAASAGRARALLQDLARGGIEQVGAADDIGDALSGVVHDHRQLVGPEPSARRRTKSPTPRSTRWTMRPCTASSNAISQPSATRSKRIAGSGLCAPAMHFRWMPARRRVRCGCNGIRTPGRPSRRSSAAR